MINTMKSSAIGARKNVHADQLAIAGRHEAYAVTYVTPNAEPKKRTIWAHLGSGAT